jgi:GNAT superfamily N-acetyltransferase
MKITVRQANINDVNFIENCQLCGVQEQVLLAIPSNLAERINGRCIGFQDSSDRTKVAYSATFLYLIAEVESLPVGLLEVADNVSRNGSPLLAEHEYHFLYVQKKYRNKHVATSLLFSAARLSISLGHHKIDVRCLHGDDGSAINFFTEIGFTTPQINKFSTALTIPSAKLHRKLQTILGVPSTP